MALKPGDKAPDFTLPDQSGEQHSLKNYRGNWVLLYFYPRDNTPGCTKEACALRDVKEDFSRLDAVVLGVSTDSAKSHQKFVDKYDLNFTLLADEDKDVVKTYDVWGPKKFMGREFLGTKRMSFLIDPNGNIAKAYEKVKPAQHAEEVLKDLEELK